jgi:hypothetical protein
MAFSFGRLSDRGREQPSSVLPADLERVVVGEQRGVEPSARFFHGFVRVVGGEHDAIHTQFADGVEQRAGVEVATGGDVEVVAEVLADLAARIA